MAELLLSWVQWDSAKAVGAKAKPNSIEGLVSEFGKEHAAGTTG